MGNKSVENNKFEVTNYDLTFVDRNGDGKFDIRSEAYALIPSDKPRGVIRRSLPQNDPEYREFKAEFKRLNLDISKPVTAQTLEGYLGKIRATQDKIDVGAMATNMRAYTSSGRLDVLSHMLQRLNHAIDRDVLDKTQEQVQPLRISLLQARDMIVAKLEGTTDKKQLFKLLQIAGAIEHASYRLSLTPEKYHFEEKFAEFHNQLQPQIPLK